MLNKQSRIADKGPSSSLGVGRVVNNPIVKKLLRTITYNLRVLAPRAEEQQISSHME
jgi:hypothetical protein